MSAAARDISAGDTFAEEAPAPPPLPQDASILIQLSGFDPRGKASVRWSGPDQRWHQSSKTTTYHRRLRKAAEAAMVGRPPFEGAVSVQMVATFTIPKSWPKRDREAALRGALRHIRKPDWDNLAKMCDALKGLMWLDDCQVAEGAIVKRYGLVPSLTIRVTPL